MKIHTEEAILIFEDDEVQASTLWNILTDNGYLAVIAENTTQAQSLMTSAAIALIDLRLSEKSGLEVLQELKQVNPASEAIIITGFADMHSAIDSLNLGAYAYLEKPVDHEKLLFLIKKALEKRLLYLGVKRREQEIKGLTVITSDILNERIRLLEEAKQKEERLSRLYRSISLSFKSLDPLQSGKELLPLIAEACEANYVSLSTVGHVVKLEDRVEYFKDMEPIKIVIRFGGSRDEVIKTGRPIIIPDLTKHPNPNPSLLAAGLKSMAGYPLQAEGITYATLFVYSFKEDAFDKYREVLSSLADLCAIPLRIYLHYREAEKARRAWETVMDEMRPGILLMDKDRKILRANKAFAQLVRRKMEELLGKNVCELVHGHPEPIHDCPMEKVCQTGEPSIIRIKEPFLKVKKLELRVVPIKEADGKISYFLHIFQDIEALYHR